MKKILFFPFSILFFITAHAQNTNELWATNEHGGTDGIGSIVKMNLNGSGVTEVFSFNSPYPGSAPLNLMQASNGKLYGTTESGGSHGVGVLFCYDPVTASYAKLYDMDGSPSSKLIEASNGKLYGTTFNGGINNSGTLFSFDLTLTTCSKIFDFDGTNGKSPSGNLVQASNGKIYGTTDDGGLNNAGVLFSMDLSANTYTKLFDYGGTNGINQQFAPGYAGHPGTLIQASNGKLYGTIIAGGVNGGGVLFSFNPSSNTYSKLFDYNVTDGISPYGMIMQASNGKIYGRTRYGGANNGGVLYSFDPSTNTYSTVFNAYLTPTSTDGNRLNGNGIIEGTGGILYGATNEGGGSGVLFSYNLSTNTYSTLHNFSISVIGQVTQLPNGKIYGITWVYQGVTTSGYIFSFDPATSTYSDLHDFDNATFPKDIIRASNGKLYGVTTMGGNAHDGLLFSFDPSSSTYADQVSFSATLNGRQPRGNLLSASDGKLYGMTVVGGTNDAGVLYSFDPSTSTIQNLFSFDLTNGWLGVASVIQASNGKLYGMTFTGGNNGGTYPYNGGVLFSYDPVTSTFTNIFDFSFTNSTNATGNNPAGSLIQASNGKLYGMTENGGANPGLIGIGAGVIFSLDPATNTFTNLFDFGGVSGESPWSDLMQASDGKLYGMTPTGGAEIENTVGAGVLFSFDPVNNTYTKLYDFKRDGTGFFPAGNLVQASNGKLYGTTYYTTPHESGNGVIFSFDPSTSTYTNVYNFDGVNGSHPNGKITLGSDGKIYGKTRWGGASAGVIFSFDPATNTYTNLGNNGITGPAPGLNRATGTGTQNNLRGGNQATTSDTTGSASASAGGILEVPATGIVAKVTARAFCAGPAFSVSYQLGYTSVFNPGNIFKVQLSDASGSFASPVQIGMVNSTVYGTIQATIPANTPTGSGYRIRVVSTNPVLTGSDNGANLSIGTPVITPATSTTFCPGSSVVLKATAGNSYLWSTGATTQSITSTTSSTYTVTVAGCGTSAPVSTVVMPGATITSQPVSQSVSAGTTVTFSVVATGTGLTYQWKKGTANLVNGTRISGATTSTLSISFVSSADASTYKCIVTAASGCAAATSNATLTVTNAAPVISSQPALPATTPCNGGSVAFTVAATGSGLSYQWYKGVNPLSNGGNITGATTTTLTISSLSSNDAANYSVVVTNSLGSTTSNIISLTINDKVIINSQPQASQLVCVSGTATLTVGATGSGLTYKWRKGTTVLSDMTTSSGSVISGSQTATITISNARTTDAATNYNCQVIGSCNTVTSAYAVIKVGAPATPGAITVTGGDNSGNTICPAGGDTKTCSIAAVSGATYYTWSVPSNTSGVSLNGGGTTVTGTAQNVTVTFSSGFTAASVVLSVVSGNTCAASAAKTVTFTNGRPAQPSTITGGSTSVCPGTFITGYQITNAGLTYNWTATGDAVVNGSGNTATVTFGSVFPVTLSVTGSNTCGTSTARTLVINQKAATPATPSTITGSNYGICANTTKSYSVTAVANVTYVWAFKIGVDTFPIPGSTNAVNVTFPSTFTTASGTLMVKGVNICGISSANRTLSIYRAPATPAFITPTSSACTGTTYSYAIHAVKGATSYLWSSTSGTAVSITTTSDTTANVVFNSAGSRNVSVKGLSSCTSVTKSLTVTVTNCAREGQIGDDVSDFNVYPNPAGDNVTIMYSTSTPVAYKISLKDITGREVLVQQGTSTEGINNIHLNLDHLAHGAYTIILVSGDNRYQRKLMVE